MKNVAWLRPPTHFRSISFSFSTVQMKCMYESLVEPGYEEWSCIYRLYMYVEYFFIFFFTAIS